MKLPAALSLPARHELSGATELRPADGHGDSDCDLPVRGSDRRRWLGIAGLVTVAVLVVLVVSHERAGVVDAERVLGTASPIWVVAMGAMAALSLCSLVLTHARARRVAGIRDSGVELIRPVLQSHFLNLVAKSNGLAGLAALTRHARRADQSPGPVTAAYLLAGICQQIAFAIVALVAFAVLMLRGDLTLLDLAAGLAFFVYVAVNVTLIAAAVGSRSRTRSIHRWMHRLLPGGNDTVHDDGPADELYDSAQLIRTNPRAALSVVVVAVCVDAALVLMLAAALEAVGAPGGIELALVAFGISTLFGILGFLPAGLGFSEASSVAVLVAAGVDPGRAAAATVLYRIGELWIPLLVGVAAGSGRAGTGWWRPLRAAAAVLALAAGVAGLIAAADSDTGQRLRVGETVVGVFRTDRFVTALFAVGLCSLAPALWRGKRWAAFAAPVAAIAAVWVAPAHRGALAVIVVALVLVCGFGVSAFGVRTDPHRVRSGLRRFVFAQAAVLGYGIGGLYFLDQNFREATSLFGSAREGFRLLFLLPPNTVQAATTHGAVFIESVRLLSLISVAAFVLSVLVPLMAPQGRNDRSRAAAVVNNYATGSLAHFTLWDDKIWTVVKDGMVAHHLTGNVALALGGPIGSPEGRAAALAEWVKRCDIHGWIPALHQVGDDDQELLQHAGFRLQHVGADAVIDVESFTLEGSHWKSIRSTLARLERSGHRVEELAHPIGQATIAELAEVSDAWRADGGHRERTFTLGQFSAAYLEATRVIVVRDSDDRIAAFINIVPAYQGSTGTFDMMRRRPDAANGVMDLLFVTMITTFRTDGLKGMNLGMAPLALVPDDDITDRALLQLRSHGEHWFNFEGLYRYKDKWRPRWEPRYLAYRNSTDLPAVLRAVQTAGELPDESSLAQRGRRLVERFPVSIGLGALLVWAMVATKIDTTLHPRLIRTFGLGWGDLTNGEVWRVFSAPLIQAHPGVPISNFAMLVVFVPLAEWIYESRRTLLTFWLGDLLTVLPFLVGLKLAGTLGWSQGDDLAMMRDAGSSAALWAVGGSLLARIPSPPHRYLATGAVAFVHLTLWISSGQLFDAQHLLAVCIGYAIGLRWSAQPPEGTDDRAPKPARTTDPAEAVG